MSGFAVCCVAEGVRVMLRSLSFFFWGIYILLETLNILQTEHNVFNQGPHVAYRENCDFRIRGEERDTMEDECLICQKDPLMSALQPTYQLLPQLLQWVPPYRRPVLGDGHIHLPKSAGILWWSPSRYQFPHMTGKDLGRMECLRQEELYFQCTGHSSFRKFIYTQDSNDVLEGFVIL